MYIHRYEDVDSILTAVFYVQSHSCSLQCQCVLPLPPNLRTVNKRGGCGSKKAVSFGGCISAGGGCKIRKAVS